ncbi:MAG TPA: hypothetical protein VKR31_10225 [Rhizomicrobium sp.]|nr:hypothetical protein [Rhizomicrobium sp.]
MSDDVTEEVLSTFREALGVYAFPPSDEDLSRAIRAVAPLIAAREREACAKVAEMNGQWEAARIASAIRSRTVEG